MEGKIEQLLLEHIALLRRHVSADINCIYEFPVYSSVFVEDIKVFQTQTVEKKSVLDFGCGRGTSSFILAGLGFDVTGLEIKFSTLAPDITSYVLPETAQIEVWEDTKKLNKGGSLTFEFYDGFELPFPDSSFDSIFACAVLEHVTSLELTLKELFRILKTGGKLFVCRTPNKYSYMEKVANILGIPAHDNMYTKKEIKDYIEKAGFVVESDDLVDFFPSNVINKTLDGYYQKAYKILHSLDKAISRTPLSIVSHHHRLFSKKV